MSSNDQAGSEAAVIAAEALAHRTGFSPEAIETMRRSVARGGGRMAQFDHREFGGVGQWMRGGMLMIGEPSNHELKRRIEALCDALSQSLSDEAGSGASSAHPGQGYTIGDGDAGQRLDQPTWYPASLGTPTTSGTQNDLRYAWFAAKQRLAVDRRGVVTLYDTGDHRIAGVSQQQGAGQRLTFSGQHGDIDLERLPVVESAGGSGPGADHRDHDRDPFVAIERLADLHARGILDDGEFAAKKSELLKRI